MSNPIKPGFPKHKQRTRDPLEALPPSISVFKLPTYQPEPVHSVRPGADDHQKVRSRGYPT